MYKILLAFLNVQYVAIETYIINISQFSTINFFVCFAWHLKGIIVCISDKIYASKIFLFKKKNPWFFNIQKFVLYFPQWHILHICFYLLFVFTLVLLYPSDTYSDIYEDGISNINVNTTMYCNIQKPLPHLRHAQRFLHRYFTFTQTPLLCTVLPREVPIPNLDQTLDNIANIVMKENNTIVFKLEFGV